MYAMNVIGFLNIAKICHSFLNTPSEIHVSDLPHAKSKVAKHYAQCDFKQNDAYFIRGVKKAKL